MTREPSLRVTGLGKRYGRNIWALRDCTLDLPQGGVTGLVGRNGRWSGTWPTTASRHYTEYHPNGSFWTMQAIESTLFPGFAAAPLAAAVWDRAPAHHLNACHTGRVERRCDGPGPPRSTPSATARAPSTRRRA